MCITDCDTANLLHRFWIGILTVRARAPVECYPPLTVLHALQGRFDVPQPNRHRPPHWNYTNYRVRDLQVTVIIDLSFEESALADR